MKLFGMLLGLGSLPLFCLGQAGGQSELALIAGIVCLLLGALLFAAGARADKRNLEERRHREMLEATRQRYR